MSAAEGVMEGWFTYQGKPTQTILGAPLTRDCRVEIVIQGTFTAEAHERLTRFLALLGSTVEDAPPPAAARARREGEGT